MNTKQSVAPRKTDEHPTGLLIWDGGKLMQEWEYTLKEWTGDYWMARTRKEWREVETKRG